MKYGWYSILDMRFKNSSGNNVISRDIILEQGLSNVVMGNVGNINVSNTITGNISSKQRVTHVNNKVLGISNVEMNRKINGDVTSTGNTKTNITMNGSLNILKGNSFTDWGTNTFKFSGNGETIVTGNFEVNATAGDDAITNVEFGSSKNTLNGNILAGDVSIMKVDFIKGDNTINGDIRITLRKHGGNVDLTVNFSDQTTTNTITGEIYTGYQSPVNITMKGSASNTIERLVRADSAGSTLNLSLGNNNSTNAINGKIVSLDSSMKQAIGNLYSENSKIAVLANYANIKTSISGNTTIDGSV